MKVGTERNANARVHKEERSANAHALRDKQFRDLDYSHHAEICPLWTRAQMPHLCNGRYKRLVVVRAQVTDNGFPVTGLVGMFAAIAV
jgi:hypothetical protein